MCCFETHRISQKKNCEVGQTVGLRDNPGTCSFGSRCFSISCCVDLRCSVALKHKDLKGCSVALKHKGLLCIGDSDLSEIHSLLKVVLKASLILFIPRMKMKRRLEKLFSEKQWSERYLAQLKIPLWCCSCRCAFRRPGPTAERKMDRQSG